MHGFKNQMMLKDLHRKKIVVIPSLTQCCSQEAMNYLQLFCMTFYFVRPEFLILPPIFSPTVSF